LIIEVCRAFCSSLVLPLTPFHPSALIWEQEVGGSNPPAPTGRLRVCALAPLLASEVGVCHRKSAASNFPPVPSSLDVVKAWVAACNESDGDAALALCDSSMELVEAKALPGAVTATGIDAVRRYLERFSAHWSEVQWLPQEFLESGDKVFMRARLRLRGRRSGIEVDREWIYVFTVRHGKLMRQDGFDDRIDGLRAAGIEAA
jgi:ketosteroid isomerase-like protein